MKYTTTGDPWGKTVYTKLHGFENANYRTVTFKKSPTGDLLAFLQENAILL